MTNPINHYTGLRSYFTQDATNNGTLSFEKITLGISAVSGIALTVIGGLALKGLILVGITAGYKLGILTSGLVLTHFSISLLADLREYAINNACINDARTPFAPTSPADLLAPVPPYEDESTAILYAACNVRDPIVQDLYEAPSINVNQQDNLGWTPLMLPAEHGHTEAAQDLLAAPGINVNQQVEDQQLQEALRASAQDLVDPNFSEADPTQEERLAFPGVDNLRLLLESGERLYEINTAHKFNLSFLTSRNNNNPEATDEQATEFFMRDEHFLLYPNVDPENGYTPVDRFTYRERFIQEYFNNQLNRDPQAKSQLKQIVQKFLDRNPADSNYNTDLGDFILRASSIVGHCSGNFKSQIQALYDKYVEGEVVGAPTERFKKLIYKFLYNYRKEIFTNTVLGICNDAQVIEEAGAHIANSQIYYQRTQGARYGLHFPLALADGAVYDRLRATTDRNGVRIEECIAQAFEREYTAENIVQRFLTHFNNPGDTNDPIRRALTTGELTRWIERNYNIDTSTQAGGQQVYDLDEDTCIATLKEGIVTLLLHRFHILRVV